MLARILIGVTIAALIALAPWGCHEERDEPGYTESVGQGPTGAPSSGGPGAGQGSGTGGDGGDGEGGDGMGGAGGSSQGGMGVGGNIGTCDLSGACDQCTVCTQFGTCVDQYVSCTNDFQCDQALECLRNCHIMCADDSCYGACSATCQPMDGFAQAYSFVVCFCHQGCASDCAFAAPRDCMQFYQ